MTPQIKCTHRERALPSSKFDGAVFPSRPSVIEFGPATSEGKKAFLLSWPEWIPGLADRFTSTMRFNLKETMVEEDNLGLQFVRRRQA
jgi:hypothetical protein